MNDTPLQDQSPGAPEKSRPSTGTEACPTGGPGVSAWQERAGNAVSLSNHGNRRSAARSIDLFLLVMAGICILTLLIGGIDTQWGRIHFRMHDPTPLFVPVLFLYLLRFLLIREKFPYGINLSDEGQWRVRAALFFALLPVLRYWDVLGFARVDSFWSDDAFALFYPLRVLHHREGALSVIQSWNPYVAAGFPNVSDLSTGFLYPLNVLFSLLPYEGGRMPFRAFAAQTLLHLSVAGWGTALLARRLGIRRGGALFAGILVLLSGFLSGHKVHSPAICAFAWLPLLLYYWDIILQHGVLWSRNLVWACVLFALILFAGDLEIALLAGFLAVAWMIFCREPEDLRNAVIVFCLIAVLGSLLAGIAVVPHIEYLDNADRHIPRFAYVAGGSLPVRLLATAFVPSLPSLVVRDYREFCIYLGAFTPVLLGLACLLRLRGTMAGLRWLLVISVLLMLGGASGLWRAIYAFIPPIRWIHTPAHFGWAWTLTASLLAAYGLERLSDLSREGRAMTKRALAAASVLFGIVCLAGIAVFVVRGGPGSDPSILDEVDHLAAIAFILGLNLVILFLWYRRTIRRRSFILLIATVAVLDLSGDYLAFDTAGEQENVLNNQPAVLSWFEKQQPPFRVCLNKQAFENLGFFRPLETFDGYGVRRPASIARLSQHLSQDRLLDLLNVRWVVGKVTDDAFGPIVHQKRDAVIQENLGALPRYRVVYQTKWATREGLYEAIESSDPERVTVISERYRKILEPLLKGINVPKGSPNTEIKILQYDPRHEVRLQVGMPAKGILIAAEPDLPCWKAKVDGKPVTTFPADGGLRGMVVPSGRHTVVYQYTPTGLWIGLMLTLLGGFLIVEIFLRTRKTD